MTTKANEDLKMNAKELLAAAERVAEIGTAFASIKEPVADEIKAAKATRASVEDIAGDLLKVQSHLVRAIVEEQAGLEKAVIAAVQAALKKSRSNIQWEIREAQEVLNRFEFSLAFSGATQDMREIEDGLEGHKSAYDSLRHELDRLIIKIRHAARD